MKVALCLSGQPRVVEVGYHKLKATILDNNDVDLFIHTWFDQDNLSTESVIPGRDGHQLDPGAIDKLIQCAINYYIDFILPNKKYEKINDSNKKIFEDILNFSGRL